MNPRTALARLTRRLDLIGVALLAAAAVGFVWAIGFTHGVAALIDALVIACAGFLAPGLAVLWVSWIIGSAAGEDRAPMAPVVSARRQWTLLLRNYAAAAAAVALAAGARELLTPYLFQQAPYPTFFLAVAVAAWIGGMGPALFAIALSVPTAWALFVRSAAPLSQSPGELVGASLFVAVALAIGGITAALGLAQMRARATDDELSSRRAALAESEARFRELADRSVTMLWVADATGTRTFFNRAWTAFTGSESERLVTQGWTNALHERDRERCLAQQRTAVEAREPFTLHYHLRRQDGEFRSCVDHGRPRFLSDGTLAGFIGECVDVTDLSQPLRTLASAAPPASDGSLR